MSRAVALMTWAAIVVLTAVWWSPSILLAVAALAADRARFRALLVWVGLLRILGRREAARRVCEAAMERSRRRVAKLAERWCW